MKRRVPLAVIFAVALTVAALLPLYVERTMTELMFADGSGGVGNQHDVAGFYVAMGD